jgi:large subunit ribosomal protein L31e
MAEIKTYTIPLRTHWLRKVEYKRARAAVNAIKRYIARHMKVPERDLDKVRLDVYLNNEIWSKGRSKPPARIKVRAERDGENVKVYLAEMPEYVRFAKDKAERRHKKADKKEGQAVKKEEKKEERTPSEKKDEIEKEKAVEEQNIKEAKLDAKAEKQFIKPEKAKHPQRMALKK